jgi:hypothetical protein
MFSRIRWVPMGLLCAGLMGAGVALAGSNSEHGSLVGFLQGTRDTRTIAPAPAPRATGLGTVRLDDSGMQADDFVIYAHMWQKNTAELGPLGRYQLELVARRLRNTAFPVVIETSHDDKLDMARRDMLISMLGSRGFHEPGRIVVGYSEECNNSGSFGVSQSAHTVNTGR